MKDQRRYVEFLQIFREVGFREGLNAIDDAFEPRQHSLEPERIAQTLKFCVRPIGSIERRADVFEELRAVGEDAGSNLVESLYRQAPGLTGVFSISGGTALICTALATRFVPWRPV